MSQQISTMVDGEIRNCVGYMDFAREEDETMVKLRFIPTFLLVVLAGFDSVEAADQMAGWQGEAGFWSEAEKWSTAPIVPGNCPCNEEEMFDVTIEGEVTLDQDVSIQQLKVGKKRNGKLDLSAPWYLMTESASLGTPIVRYIGGLPALAGRARGDVELSGAGTRWANEGDITIGDAAPGAVRLSDGAQLDSETITLGTQWCGNGFCWDVYGSGQLNVSGKETQVRSKYLSIGRYGNSGTLLVSDDGRVESAVRINSGGTITLDRGQIVSPRLFVQGRRANLNGTGQVTGDLFVLGGSLEPTGVSVAGSVEFDSASRLSVDTANASPLSQGYLEATGAIKLSGALVLISTKSLPTIGVHWISILSANAISGEFENYPIAMMGPVDSHIGAGQFLKGIEYADQTVSAAILQARPGDCDGDGNVNFRDFLCLSSNYGTEPSDWETADFDLNGKTGFEDFLILSRNFEASRAIMSVPEPQVSWSVWAASLVLMLLRFARV